MEEPFAYHPTISLRSESGSLLTLPQTCGVMYSNTFFRNAASTLWDILPVNIKQYRTLDAFKKVKTNLFVSAFPNYDIIVIVFVQHVCAHVCVCVCVYIIYIYTYRVSLTSADA